MSASGSFVLPACERIAVRRWPACCGVRMYATRLEGVQEVQAAGDVHRDPVPNPVPAQVALTVLRRLLGPETPRQVRGVLLATRFRLGTSRCLLSSCAAQGRATATRAFTKSGERSAVKVEPKDT